MTSGFDLGDLRFAFETPGPHKSTDQPKFGKGHFLTLVTSDFDLGDLRYAFEAP